MVCRGVEGGVPSLMTPEKRQGLGFEGVIPMYLRILVMRLYQCGGDRLRP